MTQNQHYVPKLLLRGFLSRDAKRAAKEQVHVLDLIEKRYFTPSIENIMAENKYNEFKINEENIAEIETALSKIEGYIAPLIKRIREEKILEQSAQIHQDLAYFVALQFIRTKKTRLFPKRIYEKLRNSIVKMGFDPSKVDGLHDFDSDELKKFHSSHQVKMIDKYAEMISDKVFFLMAPPINGTFYVSDHPVVLHTDEPKNFYNQGLGLGTPYIQIHLPLSAEIMLCAYDAAILGQLKKQYDLGLKELQQLSLGRFMRREISKEQMKYVIDGFHESSPINSFLNAIKLGNPISIDNEHLKCYNSLQVFQAERFVIDPDGRFDVAKEIIAEGDLNLSKLGE
jgi:Protein of unknown function (DUF4238)